MKDVAFRNVNIDAEAEKQDKCKNVRLPRQIFMCRVIEMIPKNPCIAGKTIRRHNVEL